MFSGLKKCKGKLKGQGESRREGALWTGSQKCVQESRETSLAEETVRTGTQGEKGPGLVFWPLWQVQCEGPVVWTGWWVQRRGRLVLPTYCLWMCYLKKKISLDPLSNWKWDLSPSKYILSWKITNIHNIRDPMFTSSNIVNWWPIIFHHLLPLFHLQLDYFEVNPEISIRS